MMLIKCRHCGKEFDKPSHRNQHEKDAHKIAKAAMTKDHNTEQAVSETLRVLVEDLIVFLEKRPGEPIHEPKLAAENLRAALQVAHEPVAYQLDALSKDAEDKRNAEENPNLERIYLGMRDAYGNAARIVRGSAQVAQEEGAREKSYGRAEVQKWRDDIAHAAADMVQKALQHADGDWAWLSDSIRALASAPQHDNYGGAIDFTFAIARPEPNQWCVDSVRGEQMDAAIDAALAKEQGNEM